MAQEAETGLLALPVEIRIKIYRYCFKYRDHPSDVDWVTVDSHSNRILVKPRLWPIFQLCKKVYCEAVPEYYASTEFRFSSIVHLKQAIAHHALFKTYARNVLLHPQLTYPTVDDLLLLPNLQTFTIAGGVAYQPASASNEIALHPSILRTGLNKQYSYEQGNMMRKALLCCKNHFHLRFRFRYHYRKLADQPNKRNIIPVIKARRMVDYDITNDVFILSDPVEDRNSNGEI